MPSAAFATTLLDETFTGAVVPDPRAIPLGDACLTAAPLGSTPPADASQLTNCQGTTNNSPAPGVSPGWLQLTDDRRDATGGMTYNRALPSSAGLIVEFDQAQYGNTIHADGISFFLSDGAYTLNQTGAAGAALGYGQRRGVPGVTAGYLGVGLDSWGNFMVDSEDLGSGCATTSPFPGRIANSVTLRGPGNGMDGYCWLASSATAPSGPSTLPGSLAVGGTNADAAVRNVRVTVSPGTFPTVTVEIDFTGTRTAYQSVLSYLMQDAAPPTYKFGFSASTGGVTDTHLIRNVTIDTVDELGDISLVKQVDRTNPQPDAYVHGDTIPYQFVVTNTGAEAIEDIVVTDPLIADITCPSTTLGPAGSASGSMVCTGSYTVTLADVLDPTLTNTATVTATTTPGGITVSETSSAVVDLEPAVSELALEKTATLNDENDNGLADLGETITYTFVVTNTGTVPVTGVTVDDPLAGAVTCEQTTLAPGASTDCTADEDYTVTVDDVLAGSILNTATADAAVPTDAPPLTPDTDSTTTDTVAADSALALEKTATLNDENDNGLADLGETITYTFVATNTGTVPLTSVTIDDPLAGTVTCDATTLAPGASTDCVADEDYTVTVDDVLAGSIFNTATADATPPAGAPALTPATDSTTTDTVAASSGLALDKIATLNDENSNGLADLGETIAYTFVATNTGTVPLTGVAIDDPLVGSVTCAETTLAPGASTDCAADEDYTVTVDDVLAGSILNTATADATPPAGAPALTPATDSTTTDTVAAVTDLSLDKTATANDENGNGLAEVGETIDYSFLVTNTGTLPLTDVELLDERLASVDCPQATLAPGTSMTCEGAPYTITGADARAGSVLNVATVVAAGPGDVEVSADGSAETPVAPVGGLPATGASSIVPLAVATVALLAAGALLILYRRRRTDSVS